MKKSQPGEEKDEELASVVFKYLRRLHKKEGDQVHFRKKNWT